MALLLGAAMADLQEVKAEEIITNTVSDIIYSYCQDQIKNEIHKTILRWAIPAVVVALGAKYAYTLLTCNTTRPKHVVLYKKEWKPDVVYLFTLPRPNSTADALPHSLKVETFLRVHQITYEVVETLIGRSVDGKLPFVELNGEHLADSQLITFQLEKHFLPKMELTPKEYSLIRLITRMLDSPTFNVLLYHRAGVNCVRFLDVILETSVFRYFKHLFALFAYPRVWETINMDGTGRHTSEDIVNILRCDLRALDGVLEDNEWLVGNKPTLADCAFFGHIASSFNLPYEVPLQSLLEEEFPRLRKLHDRIARQYFPDVTFQRFSPPSNT